MHLKCQTISNQNKFQFQRKCSAFKVTKMNIGRFTNETERHSTPLTPSEASASETKEKQKLLELAHSELSRKLSGGRSKSICREFNALISNKY